MSESAWKWGPYKSGMGQPTDDQRIKYAILAIKRELAYLGYKGMSLDSPVAGLGFTRKVKKFQKANGLVADGLAGQKTCNALWRQRIEDQGVPEGWLRAQIHWESADDPGAMFANPDGSTDRGLTQVNSVQKSEISDDEAFTPSFSIPWLGAFQHQGANQFKNCIVDKWKLAVGRWRSPVGAADWCDAPATEPNKDGTWAEKVVYYVDKVNTIGRTGWTG